MAFAPMLFALCQVHMPHFAHCQGLGGFLLGLLALLGGLHFQGVSFVGFLLALLNSRVFACFGLATQVVCFCSGRCCPPKQSSAELRDSKHTYTRIWCLLSQYFFNTT